MASASLIVETRDVSYATWFQQGTLIMPRLVSNFHTPKELVGRLAHLNTFLCNACGQKKARELEWENPSPSSG